MLALGSFMVPAGRIGDIFGRRRALLAGVAVFGAASVACAVAYLQQVRGLDPVTAELAFLGPSAGAALGGVLASRLATSRPPRLIMGSTSVVAALGLAALAASGG